MAFTSEIYAKLGLDTESFKGDLKNAKELFRQLGKDIQEEGKRAGGAAGDGLGEKLAKNLKGKILGEGLSSTLATALGLNIGEISQKLAAAIVGGTKEGFENAIKTEERITAALDARDAKRKTSLQLIAAAEQEILNLQREQAKIVGSHLEVTPGNRYAPYSETVRKVAGGDLTQEEENKKREFTAKILEKQNQLIDLKNAKEETGEKEIERNNELRRQGMSDEQKINDLISEQQILADQLLSKKLNQKEIDERRAKMQANSKQINELDLKVTEAKAKQGQDLAKVQEDNAKKVRDFMEEEATGTKRLDLLLEDVLRVRKQLNVETEGSVRYNELLAKSAEAELRLAKETSTYKKTITKTEAKDEDRSKLSLGELANLDSFQSGVSVDVGNQAGQAREALKIKQQAEEARKLGNTDQAEELRSKYDTIRGGLSALKSEDRGVKEDLTQALVPTNTLLATIDKTLGGKFKAQ